MKNTRQHPITKPRTHLPPRRRVPAFPTGAARGKARRAKAASAGGCPSCGSCTVTEGKRAPRAGQSRTPAEQQRDELLFWLKAATLGGQERLLARNRACRGDALLRRLGLPVKYTACPLWQAVATFVQALRDIQAWERVSSRDDSQTLDSLMGVSPGRKAETKAASAPKLFPNPFIISH